MSLPEIRWWLIRHAPVLNPDGIIYGSTDMPADVSDAPRFDALAARLPKDAAWIVTPLSRTQDTAKRLIASGAQPRGTPQIEPPFLEQDFGDWQGRTLADVAPPGHVAWLAPAGYRPPGGESFAELCARVGPRITALCEDPPAADIVVVAHGGTIRGVLAHCLGIDPETALHFRIATLSLTRVVHITPRDGSTPAWAIEMVNG